MANHEVVICSPVQTAIGTYNGSLKDTPAVELGAAAIKACLDRAKISGAAVDSVVMGNVIQAGHFHMRVVSERDYLSFFVARVNCTAVRAIWSTLQEAEHE